MHIADVNQLNDVIRTLREQIAASKKEIGELKESLKELRKEIYALDCFNKPL